MKKHKETKFAGISDLRELLEKQEYKCALTGVALVPENTAFDHRVPVSLGGSSLADNLQAVEVNANRAKGTMTMTAFVSMCEAVVAIHRTKVTSRRKPS